MNLVPEENAQNKNQANRNRGYYSLFVARTVFFIAPASASVFSCQRIAYPFAAGKLPAQSEQRNKRKPDERRFHRTGNRITRFQTPLHFAQPENRHGNQNSRFDEPKKKIQCNWSACNFHMNSKYQNPAHRRKSFFSFLINCNAIYTDAFSVCINRHEIHSGSN